MSRLKLWFVVLVFLAGISSGCEKTVTDAVNAVNEKAAQASEYVGSIKSSVEDLFREAAEAIDNGQKYSFAVPSYTGSPYAYINNNKPFFTEEEKKDTKEFMTFSNLDHLGRCGAASGCFTSSMMPTAERGDISSIYPTGWKQRHYSFVDQEYLYNRCHLIAYSLSGENANEKNLITGTRYLNVEGMWAVEETVYWYLKENPGRHVRYRVTPVFEDNNLLCSGVLMEGYSIEDNGKGVKFCVYCFNVQPGVVIDYRTGENHAS